MRQILVEGFGGERHHLDTYVVFLQIHDMHPFGVEVVAHDDESFILLGRDVLNKFRVVLDGPDQILEIA